MAGVKAAIVRQAPTFGDSWIRSFDWRQNGNVITAKPRYPISEMCFQTVKKVFKRFGGHFVKLKGTSYFELVIKEAEQNGSKRTHTYSRMCVLSRYESPLTPGSVFSRLQNQLSNLVETGHRLTE